MTQTESDAQERNSWHKPSGAPVESLIHKERCPVDGTTQFYYTDQGISYRCRRCRAVHIVPWHTILQEHRDLCENTVPHD